VTDKIKRRSSDEDNELNDVQGSRDAKENVPITLLKESPPPQKWGISNFQNKKC
jgi:hypothetical protein